MRAVLCKEFGPPESLVVETVDDPKPGPGQIAVKVAAAGVNFPDVLIIQNKYQFKPPLPFIPGGEISGTITELGDGVDNVKVGDRILASTGVGAFAEQIAIDAKSAVPIPDEMDFSTAAATLFTYGTSHYALKDRAQLKQGETLLVLGAAGGVGLAAVELGKVMGARVIAAASTDEKLAVCKEHGADDVINYANEDLKQRTKELTDGNGADVVYDPVGGDYAEAALRATAWEGRFLVIGFTAGIPTPPLNLVLLKGCQVVGVFWGAFVMRQPKQHLANVRELMDWYKSGKIKPLVSGEFALDQVAAALNEIANRKVKGKVVIVP